MKLSLPGIVFGAACVSFAGGIGAQQFSEEALQSYAAAQEDIREITMDYREMVEETGMDVSQEERLTREHEYQRKLTQAVEEAGLTAQQYNSIQAEVMRDPALQRRVEEMMQ